MKNVYSYLEGLVKIPKYDKNESENKQKLRKQIIIEKISYFSKNKEYKVLCNEDSNRIKNDKFKDKNYRGIVKDPSEFWKYIMNEGVLHFLTDTYDEKILEFESKKSSLSDVYSLIKTKIMRIRQIFDNLERDFRLKKDDMHLDEYKQ